MKEEVFKTVVEHFANTDKTRQDIQDELIPIVLHDDLGLNLSQPELLMAVMDLSIALEDCAD